MVEINLYHFFCYNHSAVQLVKSFSVNLVSNYIIASYEIAYKTLPVIFLVLILSAMKAASVDAVQDASKKMHEWYYLYCYKTS